MLAPRPSHLRAGLALAACSCALAAGPAAAATPTLSVTFDAGSAAWTNAPTRTIHRTVTPADAPGVQLRTYVDGTLADTSSGADLPMTFSDGDHVIAVEATAPGYNTSSRPAARVRVDTTPPLVHLNVPAQASSRDNPVSGDMWADDGGMSGVNALAMTVDGTPAPYGSYFTMDLPVGPHAVHGTATDMAGNIGVADATVSVVAPPPVQRPATTSTPRPSSSPGTTRTRTQAPRYALCANLGAGEQCGPGNGRRTSGGGGKVSHRGWPAVTGVLWKVLDSGDHERTGGPDNDELIGHHGDDEVNGLGGNDILWGDWDPENNTTRQRDVLIGGAGNDWIYPSHGTNRIAAGPGADRIIAYYGHGTIDCGPGKDTAQVRMNGAYKLKGCEKVKHFN